MTDKLQHWIEHPELLDKETLYELRTLLARYPYFATARLLYLKNLYLLHDASFGDELRKAAIWIPDRKQLFNLIEGEKQSQTRQSKRTRAAQADDETCLDRTLQLIDDFLATVPEEQQPEAETVNLQSDYLSYMLREEELPEEEEANRGKPMRGQGLIDSFLEKSEGGFPRLGLQVQANEKEETIPDEEDATDQAEPTDTLQDYPDEAPTDEPLPEETEDDGFFTETLARIYIKQQRYEKALEIIKKLSLKYPKKNTYFADQIRFLEKLIINTKSK